MCFQQTFGKHCAERYLNYCGNIGKNIDTVPAYHI